MEDSMKNLLLALTISLTATSAFAAGASGVLKGQCDVSQGSTVKTYKFNFKSNETGYYSKIIKNNGSDYRIYVTNTAGLELSYENNLIDITVTPIRYFENPPVLKETKEEVDNSRAFSNPPDLEEVEKNIFPVSGREQILDPKDGDELHLNLYNGKIDFSCHAKFTTK